MIYKKNNNKLLYRKYILISSLILEFIIILGILLILCYMFNTLLILYTKIIFGIYCLFKYLKYNAILTSFQSVYLKFYYKRFI